MTLIGVESSCDETSVAVVRDGVVLANVVSSQIELHSEYGGVVPELATREHLRNFETVASNAVRSAGITFREIDGVAATRGPGLPNALMIGLKAAQGLAFGLGKPFLAINHHEAHLYSPWIVDDPLRANFDEFQPSVSLIVSGGHTMLVFVEGALSHRVLGGTIDDAAGECFDKSAKLMGLSYPGGPEMDRLAADGNPRAFSFPRPLINELNDNFSFSGLKTSVRYFLEKHPALADDPKQLADLCASVQAAIVETLVRKTMRAAMRENVNMITASGGVTCNRGLRMALSEACESAGIQLRLAPGSVCTDNAAMIAILAERKLLSGKGCDDLDLDPLPSWQISE